MTSAGGADRSDWWRETDTLQDWLGIPRWCCRACLQERSALSGQNCFNFKGRGVDLRLSKGFASRFNTKMEMVWSLKDTGHEKFPAPFVWLGSTSASWCEILHTPALRALEVKQKLEEKKSSIDDEDNEVSIPGRTWHEYRIFPNFLFHYVSLFPELQLLGIQKIVNKKNNRNPWWSHGIPSLALHSRRAIKTPTSGSAASCRGRATMRVVSAARPGGCQGSISMAVLGAVSLLVEEVYLGPEPYQVAAAHFCEQFAQSVLALCWGFRCLIAWPMDF